MIKSIQILRAIAAWMVVLHHLMQILFIGEQQSGWFGNLVWKGAIGVDIFFVISGFIIYKSICNVKISSKTFIIHRAARIIPAYWFFTIIVALISYFYPDSIFITKYDLSLLIKSLLFIPAESPSGYGYVPLLTIGWTLNYEVFFYVSVFICLLFFRKYATIGIFGLIIILSLTLPLLGKPFDFYGNHQVYEFLLGCAIGVAHKNNLSERINPYLALIIGMASITYILNNSEVHGFFFIGLPCAILVFSLLSIERLVSDNLISRVLIKLGDWSYSTYLVHVIVISLVYKAMVNYDSYRSIVVFICFLLILGLSFLSYRFIEKPFNSLVKKV